jgi:hypothetical protein
MAGDNTRNPSHLFFLIDRKNVSPGGSVQGSKKSQQMNIIP